MTWISVVFILCMSVPQIQSVVYNITNTTANWQALLVGLKAGDTAILYPGAYKTSGSGYFQLTLNGTLAKPIIIQGAPNQARPIIHCATSGASAQNVINIQGSNFMIKGIGFTKGSRGVRLGPTAVTNAIFDNIYIFNTTGAGFTANDVGIEYANITLRNSEITNPNALAATTGECVYLGCVNDACRVRDSLVDHNYCHDTLGSQGGSRAGFQVKTGSFNVRIRNNVCYNVVGPRIVVYDDYDRGRNIIDGNVAINAGTADIGIQCTSGATITNNIVINANLAGIGVIFNSVYPTVNYIRNITISHNTVYKSQADACLRLNSLTNRNITIFNNVFYCGQQKSITSTSNLAGFPIYTNAVNGTIGATGIQANGTFSVACNIFADVNTNNFYPAFKSLLIAAGTNPPQGLSAYDFNGKTRPTTKPTVGAYEYSTATNPGCPITNNFKCGSATAVVSQYSI